MKNMMIIVVLSLISVTAFASPNIKEDIALLVDYIEDLGQLTESGEECVLKDLFMDDGFCYTLVYYRDVYRKERQLRPESLMIKKRDAEEKFPFNIVFFDENLDGTPDSQTDARLIIPVFGKISEHQLKNEFKKQYRRTVWYLVTALELRPSE
jgi:hypothetical protein